VVDMSDAREMARALAYDLARRTYRLDEPTPAAHARGNGRADGQDTQGGTA
jgi:hypothetical protein